MADDSLIFVRERNLDYPVFDADNHMYENTDAFTKFLPPEYEGVVKYIDEGNRSKIAIKDRIDRAIPNPTFVRVAPPGGQQDDPLHRRSISGLDAFFDVEPRFKLMQEFGISGALMWPTLASVIEQAMPDDPLRRASRVPRAEPVDVRALDVRLRERGVPHAGDLPRGPRQGDRRVGVGGRARRAHRRTSPPRR